jgi:hypothetical protein
MLLHTHTHTHTHTHPHPHPHPHTHTSKLAHSLPHVARTVRVICAPAGTYPQHHLSTVFSQKNQRRKRKRKRRVESRRTVMAKAQPYPRHCQDHHKQARRPAHVTNPRAKQRTQSRVILRKWVFCFLRAPREVKAMTTQLSVMRARRAQRPPLRRKEAKQRGPQKAMLSTLLMTTHGLRTGQRTGLGILTR